MTDTSTRPATSRARMPFPPPACGRRRVPIRHGQRPPLPPHRSWPIDGSGASTIATGGMAGVTAALGMARPIRQVRIRHRALVS